jgi:hypothetical protein
MAWVVCHDAGSEDATIAWSVVAGAKYNLELKVAPSLAIFTNPLSWFTNVCHCNRSQGQHRRAGRVSERPLDARVETTALPGLPVSKLALLVLAFA